MEDIFTKLLGRVPKFGDKFVQNNGTITLFLTYDTIIVDDNLQIPIVWMYDQNDGEVAYNLQGEFVNEDDGINYNGDDIRFNIKSKYTEVLDREKIESLAKESLNYIQLFASAEHVAQMMRDDYIGGYYAGYVKAKSE